MAAALLWSATVNPAFSEPAVPHLVEPNETAPSGQTYGELVAIALPWAITKGGTIEVGTDVALPHIEGDEFSVPLNAPTTVSFIEALPLDMDGRSHLALLLQLPGSPDSIGPVMALALFDTTAEDKLVDLKDVGFDRNTGFSEPATLAVGAGHDLIMIRNSHGNAGQFYNAISVIDLIDDELELVDMVMTLDDYGCAGSHTQTPSYESMAPDGLGKSDFRISVEEITALPEEPCDGVEAYTAGVNQFAVDYRFDPASGRYESQGDGWAPLDDMNAERY